MIRRAALRQAAMMAFAAALGACAAQSVMPGPQEGAALFAQNCAGCHGADARGGNLSGTGRAAPDLTAIAMRNGGVLPRASVLSTIDGYAKGAHPGRLMPEFGASLEGEMVPVDIDGTLTPTPRPLAALLAYLESIHL